VLTPTMSRKVGGTKKTDEGLWRKKSAPTYTNAGACGKVKAAAQPRDRRPPSINRHVADTVLIKGGGRVLPKNSPLILPAMANFILSEAGSGTAAVHCQRVTGMPLSGGRGIVLAFSGAAAGQAVGT